jgi:TrmH family RNA methyltransferase
MTIVRQVTSRHNDLFKDLRKLLAEPTAYRKLGRIWLEGDHLCRALLERGRVPLRAIVTESGWAAPALNALARSAPEIVCIPDALMRELSGLESPAPIGFLIEADGGVGPQPGRDTIVLDRLQDPGNVGSILRTASAMGFAQVIALKGSVALWSPKVLRAGMGAHFALNLVEGADLPGFLAGYRGTSVALAGNAPRSIYELDLRGPIALCVGTEGAGLSSGLLARASERAAIPMPGPMESLNAAVAGSLCLFEVVRQRSGKGP